MDPSIKQVMTEGLIVKFVGDHSDLQVRRTCKFVFICTKQHQRGFGIVLSTSELLGVASSGGKTRCIGGYT